MQHGVQKLFGLLLSSDRPWSGPPAFSQFWFAGVLEVFGGEPVVLFCFIYLDLFAVGGGPYSLDAALFGRRRTGHDAA